MRPGVPGLLAPNLIPAYRQRAALFDAAGEKFWAEADRKEVGRIIADLARQDEAGRSA